MKKLLILGTIGVVVAISLWFGRSAYRNYKEKRAATQAEQFFQKKEFSKAMLSARQALQSNPNNLAACRIMASISEAAGSPSALDWRKRIAELDPTTDNQILLASSALRFEPPPFLTAQDTLKKISPQATHSASYHGVVSQLALHFDDRTKAERHLSEAVRLDPKNDGNRLKLALMRLGSADSTVRSEARKTLESLRSNEVFSAEATRWLARDSADHGDLETALRLSNELLARKDAPDADRFEHLALLHRAKKPEFDTYLASLQVKAGNDPVEIYKVAEWKIATGKPESALQWLDTLAPALQSKRPVPVARANALAALKKWSALADFLTDQKWEEQEFLRLALLAHALRMGKENEAVVKANWNRAVRAGSENGEHLAVLTQLARKWGWETETESLLWILAEKNPQSGALESLSRVYEANRDTSGLLRVAEMKLRKNPADNLAKNNVAMISLLLNTNLVNAHFLAEEIYKADPKNWGFVSTYGYSLHRQDKTADALKLIESLPAADLNRPEIAVYHGIFLSALGEKEKARQPLALAENASLLPEEKKLLQDALKQL